MEKDTHLVHLAEQAERNRGFVGGEGQLMDFGPEISTLMQLTFARALREVGKIEADARKRGYRPSRQEVGGFDWEPARELIKAKNVEFVENDRRGSGEDDE